MLLMKLRVLLSFLSYKNKFSAIIMWNFMSNMSVFLKSEKFFKVAEAKARKRRRREMKMQAAEKKAEGILQNDDMEQVEKTRELQK